jgi:hypothetical protein
MHCCIMIYHSRNTVIYQPTSGKAITRFYTKYWTTFVNSVKPLASAVKCSAAMFVCFLGVTILCCCIFYSPVAGFSLLILEVS